MNTAQPGAPWRRADRLAVGAANILGAAGVVVGWSLERLGRALAEVRPAMRVVATVGLLLLLQGVLAAVYGTAARQSPPFLPTGTVSVAGVSVGYDQILVAAAGALGAAG